MRYKLCYIPTNENHQPDFGDKGGCIYNSLEEIANYLFTEKDSGTEELYKYKKSPLVTKLIFITGIKNSDDFYVTEWYIIPEVHNLFNSNMLFFGRDGTAGIAGIAKLHGFYVYTTKSILSESIKNNAFNTVRITSTL